MIGWIILGVVVLLLVILIAWFWIGYNNFVRKRNIVEESFATMDVYLKKRYDLIPNLVNTVKGYAKHESETLEKVISARNQAVKATTLEESIEANNTLSGALSRLLAVVEQYPDLKANENFLDLQNSLKTIESEIANSRKSYNANVRDYNTTREVFPNNILAGIFHFGKKPLYEIKDETERKNVSVEF